MRSRRSWAGAFFLSLFLTSSGWILSAESGRFTTNSIDGWNAFRLGSAFSDLTNVLHNTYFWLEPTQELKSDITGEVNTNTVRIRPNAYFQNIQFQFRRDRLYLIRLDLSPKLFSYLSVSKSLREKYGEPGEIRADRLIWKSSNRELQLERPTTIRYLDMSGLTAVTNRIFTNTLNPSLESILNSF